MSAPPSDASDLALGSFTPDGPWVLDLGALSWTRGIGVLITDHNVRETLDLVDRAAIIYDGKVLLAGSPAELVADPDRKSVV